MQKVSPHVRGAGFIALVLALALGLALPGTARAQSTTYTACYVPDAGAIYMIGQQDTPSSCLESSHVEFSWSSDTSAVSDHGNLSGLTDDDHPQYVLDRDSVVSVDSSTGFVGLNRSSPITGSDVFAVHSDVSFDDTFGGMYVETAGSRSWPFYGYAAAGNQGAWHFYVPDAGEWRLEFASTHQEFVVDSAGNVDVPGNLNVTGSKNFRIDHPLHPSGKYLKHSAVESPNRLNTYTGNVTLDDNGEATVTLPDYFQSINREVRYQLTPIGAAAPRLHVAEEIDGNQFRIAGGSPGMKVSWRVTGIRDDEYAREHPFRTEVEKGAEQPNP